MFNLQLLVNDTDSIDILKTLLHIKKRHRKEPGAPEFRPGFQDSAEFLQDFNAVIRTPDGSSPVVQGDRNHIAESVVVATHTAMIEFSNPSSHRIPPSELRDFSANQLTYELGAVVFQNQSALQFILPEDRLQEFQWRIRNILGSFNKAIPADYYRQLIRENKQGVQQQFAVLYNLVVSNIFSEFCISSTYWRPDIGAAIKVEDTPINYEQVEASGQARVGSPFMEGDGGNNSASWSWGSRYTWLIGGLTTIFGVCAGYTIWATNRSLTALLKFLADTESYNADDAVDSDLPTRWQLFLNTHGRTLFSDPNNEGELEIKIGRMIAFIAATGLAGSVLIGAIYRGGVALHRYLQRKRTGYISIPSSPTATHASRRVSGRTVSFAADQPLTSVVDAAEVGGTPPRNHPLRDQFPTDLNNLNV